MESRARDAYLIRYYRAALRAIARGADMKAIADEALRGEWYAPEEEVSAVTPDPQDRDTYGPRFRDW